MLNSQSTQVLLNKYLQPIWWRLDVDVVVVVVVVAVVVVVVVIVVRSLLRFCKNLFSKESKSKKFPVKKFRPSHNCIEISIKTMPVGRK